MDVKIDIKKAMAVLKAIQEAIPMAKLAAGEVSGLHGIIHKRAEAEINGIRGFFGLGFHCLQRDYIRVL